MRMPCQCGVIGDEGRQFGVMDGAETQAEKRCGECSVVLNMFPLLEVRRAGERPWIELKSPENYLKDEKGPAELQLTL